jgi:hypothetical protein
VVPNLSARNASVESTDDLRQLQLETFARSIESDHRFTCDAARACANDGVTNARGDLFEDALLKIAPNSIAHGVTFLLSSVG